MKRPIHYLPYAGLVLLGAALLFRGLRREGLALAAFPAPAADVLPAHEVTPPSASIAGRVLDTGGSAIPEAFILTDLGGELAWSFSDAEGSFELPHLPAGATTVEVVARHFRPRKFTLDAPSSQALFVLDERLPELEPLPELGRADLRGQLTTPATRRGLRGYEVVLLPDGPLRETGRTVPVRATVTADRGFEFPALMHGAYRVLVLPPWARSGTWPNLCARSARAYDHGPASSELVLPLAAGELSGQVLDASGDAVHGAIIEVTPRDAPERPWPPTSSDAQGVFLVADLPPGVYRVLVRAGAGRWEAEAEVEAGATSVLDVPPLSLR